MKQHLVLGCGYLGQVVAHRWLAQGHPVAALTRSRTEQFRQQRLEAIQGDVTHTDLKLPAADTVLYAIGMDRTAGKSMRDVYLHGLENVLRVLPKSRRFIYVSSTSVYGQANGDWVDETFPTEPTEESGQIILECEQLLRRHLPEAIILRFAGIYGPNRVIRRAAIERGEPLTTAPEHWLNLIHVDDGANAVVAAADHGRAGTYNIADNCPVTRRDFYTTMAELLNAPVPQFQPTTGADNNRRVSNEKMRAELGMVLRYPSFREGLKQAIG
jgi:nucleoside-diphosphate-sugar epimerase